MLEVREWVKMECRMGARAGVQDFRIKTGVWSGPVVLFEYSVVSSFRMPLVEM